MKTKALSVLLLTPILLFSKSAYGVGSQTPAPTNVGAYFKAENGFMVSWSIPSDYSKISGYTVTASNGAKCVTNSASKNSCIYNSSIVPFPFKPYVSYTFTVVSNSKFGDSEASVPSNPTAWLSAPGYPAPILTKVVSDTQVAVEWVPSYSTGGIPNYGYRITYWEAQLNAYGDPKNDTRKDLITTSTSANISGLKPSTWYVFSVAQCNYLGCSVSDWSYIMTTPKVGVGATWRPPLSVNGGSANTSCWDAVLNGGTAAASGNFSKSTTKCGTVTIDPTLYPKLDPSLTNETVPNLVNKFSQNIYLGGWQPTYSLATWQKINVPWVPFLQLASKSTLLGFVLQPSVISTTPTVCVVNGNMISLLQTGTCTISASAPGNGVWLPSGTTNGGFKVIA